MKVAVINSGSSSIKYEVFALPDCVHACNRTPREDRGQ